MTTTVYSANIMYKLSFWRTRMTFAHELEIADTLSNAIIDLTEGASDEKRMAISNIQNIVDQIRTDFAQAEKLMEQEYDGMEVF